MIYFLLLCVLFAVTAIFVTSTVCAIIGILTIIEELWKVFRKFCRKVYTEILDEINETEEENNV